MKEIFCARNKELILYTEEDTGDYIFPEDPLEFLGFGLHAKQQGQAVAIQAYGYNLSAILVDQTCGVITSLDILRTSHPKFKFQRVYNILSGNFINS